MASSKLTPGQSQQTAQTENPQNLPATQGGTAPVPYRGDSTNHDDGARDRKTDKLGIVNGVGPLFKKFPKNVGEIVFGERLPLGTEVEVIPVRLRKYYVEIRRNGVDLKYGDGTTPKIFKTAAEANAAGYAVDWDSNHVNKAQEAGEILLLVAGPADDLQDAFYIELDGKNWAPALFNVRRGGYREVYRLYKTIEDRAIARGSRLHGTVFKLWAFFKEGDQNSWYEPRSEAVRKLSPDAFAKVEEARQRLEGKADETPTAAGD